MLRKTDVYQVIMWTYWQRDVPSEGGKCFVIDETLDEFEFYPSGSFSQILATFLNDTETALHACDLANTLIKNDKEKFDTLKQLIETILKAGERVRGSEGRGRESNKRYPPAFVG